MSRRPPLPPDLGDAFSVTAALSAGVSASRLRARDLRMPTHGVRAIATRKPEEPQATWQKDARRADIMRRVQETAPALLPSQFFSHETALILVGCPLPRSPYRPRVHVSAHRPTGTPRRKEWIGHRLQARHADTRLVRGIRVECPARAWRQAGSGWDVDDLVAAADFLVHPRRRLATLDELVDEVDLMGDVGGGMLRHGLSLVRVGAESPEETALRLLLARAGLPEPRINFELRTSSGRLIARLDLAFTAYRVAVEYDGRVHAEDAGQFQRDADRWDDIRAAGWRHVRILSHHVRPDPQTAVRKVVAALVAAGWPGPGIRPGAMSHER